MKHHCRVPPPLQVRERLEHDVLFPSLTFGPSGAISICIESYELPSQVFEFVFGDELEGRILARLSL